MDNNKTGLLIAQTRKELGMTQKQLAEKLNISDRAVSKWERGAGFPDVSLIEPLADALGLNVLEILRGERMPEEERRTIDDVTVREALQVLGRHGKRQTGYVLKTIQVLFAMFAPFVIMLIFILQPAGAKPRWENQTEISVWSINEGSFTITESTDLASVKELLETTYFCTAFWAEDNRWGAVPQMVLNLRPNGPDIEYYANGVVYVCTDKGVLMALPVGGELHEFLYYLRGKQVVQNAKDEGISIPREFCWIEEELEQ